MTQYSSSLFQQKVADVEWASIPRARRNQQYHGLSGGRRIRLSVMAIIRVAAGVHLSRVSARVDVVLMCGSDSTARTRASPSPFPVIPKAKARGQTRLHYGQLQGAYPAFFWKAYKFTD